MRRSFLLIVLCCGSIVFASAASTTAVKNRIKSKNSQKTKNSTTEGIGKITTKTTTQATNKASDDDDYYYETDPVTPKTSRKTKLTTRNWKDFLGDTKRVSDILANLNLPTKNINDSILRQLASTQFPYDFIYEDDRCMAFYAAAPQAPVHAMIMPRKWIRMLSEFPDEDEPLLGHMMMVAKRVAEKLGLRRGYRVVINNGPDGLQLYYHFHIHVIGGREMHWPPG